MDGGPSRDAARSTAAERVPQGRAPGRWTAGRAGTPQGRRPPRGFPPGPSTWAMDGGPSRDAREVDGRREGSPGPITWAMDGGPSRDAREVDGRREGSPGPSTWAMDGGPSRDAEHLGDGRWAEPGRRAGTPSTWALAAGAPNTGRQRPGADSLLPGCRRRVPHVGRTPKEARHDGRTTGQGRNEPPMD